MRLALKWRQKRQMASENLFLRSDVVQQSSPQPTVPREADNYSWPEAPTASENSSLKSDIYHCSAQPSIPREPYNHSRLEARTHHPQQPAPNISSLRGHVICHPGPQLSVPRELYEYSRLGAQTFHPQRTVYKTSSLRSDFTYQSGAKPSWESYMLNGPHLRDLRI